MTARRENITDDPPSTYDAAELHAALTRAREEAHGLWSLDLVPPWSWGTLLADATAGDPAAIKLLNAVAAAKRRMRKAPKHQPTVCLSCPRHIRKQHLHRITFAIAAPMVEHTTPVLGAVLCPKCAADPDHGMAKAMAGIRRMMPGAQPIIVHPNGGQA